MARSLDAIIQELDAGYNPQRQLINEKIAALPAQADAEIEGLKGQQTQAFDQIMGGARERGVAFGGIPIAEQAKYTASAFLPAVARVRQSQNDTKTSLFGALNDVGLDQRKTASSIYQQELDRDEAIRQFNERQRAEAEARAAAEREAAAQRAAAAKWSAGGALGGLFGGGGGGGGGAPAATMAKKAQGNGFEFKDARGGAISAAKYAQLTGSNIADVLRVMGQQGDSYAANAYNWLQRVQGMDFVNSPQKLMAAAQKNFSPLFWGA